MSIGRRFFGIVSWLTISPQKRAAPGQLDVTVEQAHPPRDDFANGIECIALQCNRIPAATSAWIDGLLEYDRLGPASNSQLELQLHVDARFFGPFDVEPDSGAEAYVCAELGLVCVALE